MFTTTISNQTILTGDRPTGPLHLGHYAGSLRNRVKLQEANRQFILIADYQALTDNAHDPDKVRRNVLSVALDYLAVGIDPAKTTICLQSALPALSELTMLYMNLVTVSRLERNPTIRQEIRQRGFERHLPAGFLCYPVSQAADITAFKANLVPVGEDQLPIIEQTNEIAHKINQRAGYELLPMARALVPEAGARLPGADGKAKMSKSMGNTIPLNATETDISTVVRSMYTDPGHLRVSDPGQVEGNVVFSYLDAFDPDREELQALKDHYRKGGLGDSVLKRRLDRILQELLAPIRERRSELEKDPSFVLDIMREGSRSAAAITGATLSEVRETMGVLRLY